MIDNEVTFKRFGYTSDMLKTKSAKPIIRVCDKCGESREIAFYKYRGLCKKCAQQKRRQLPIPKYVSEQNRFIKDTQIDRIKTIEKFGYDPIDLKDKSNKKVISTCKICGKIKIITKNSYHNLSDLEYLPN